ncbi:MAG: hypothetical protein IJ457_08705 [Clostridia bacterium]|nr:hypothetical protein [Clostridia bacterium]
MNIFGCAEPHAIRCGCPRFSIPTVGGGAIDAPFERLSPYGTAVTSRTNLW